MTKTQDLLTQFKSLSASAQSEVLQSFRVEFEGKGKLLEVAQLEIITKKTCPYCGTGRVHKRGKQSGVQMYKCAECSKMV